MRTLPLLLSLSLALPACSGPGAAGPDGNVVFLTQPSCPTFVVKTYGGRFGVLENREAGYTPRAADLLEGDLGQGDGVLQFIPDRALRQGEDAQPIAIRVAARSVDLDEAQDRFRDACPRISPEDSEEALPDDLDAETDDV